MNRLNKEQKAQQQEHVVAIRAAHTTLTTAITTLNTTLGEEWKKIEAALKAYNERIGEANTFLAGLAKDAQEWHDGRAERWKEEKGDDHQGWINESLGPLETAELERPEDVEIPDDAASELEGRDEGP